jgi:hydrogenase maturation protease
MRPALVLCLGNEILTDDSFGFKIAKKLKAEYDFKGKAEVVFSPLGGLNLIELLRERERVLIIDTLMTKKAAPGTLHFFEMGHFTPTKNLTCSHQISLPTALRFGRELGIDMPEKIDVLAVEAKDIETLNENLTPPVLAAIGPAIDKIIGWIEPKMEESNHDEQGKRKGSIS